MRLTPIIINDIIMKRIISAADFGSNTCHLIVGSTTPGNFNVLADESEWLYLGKEIGSTGKISSESTQRIIDTVEKFKKTSKKCKCEKMLIFGTESLRSASNSEKVLQKIKEKTDIEILLIPGDEEARISHKATMLDTFTSAPSLFVEVGGGSTQVCYCFGTRIQEVVSMPIGTSRLIAKCNITYPCPQESIDKIHEIVDKELEKISHFRDADCMVAAGGLARGAIKALHPDNNRNLDLIELEYLAETCGKLSEETLVERYPLKTRRAVTILPGAIVISKIMKKLNMNELTVSNFGIREGMILEILEGNYPGTTLKK